MKKFLLFFAALIGMFGAKMQAGVFEASPQPLQQSTEGVVITFNANECDVAALKNLSTDLYAHIGVYTTKSPAAWSHVKTGWSENTAANTFKRVAANKYQLTIGNMRTYFGVTDAKEIITKICVIARTADGSAQTKDYFIDVQPDGYAMEFLSTPGTTVMSAPTSYTFKAYATENSTIKILVNGNVVKEATNVKSLEYTQKFETKGKGYDVVAEATNGKETISKEINLLYIGDPMKMNYPGGTPKQGAVKNADGSVTFCLAAPNKNNVVLVGSWDNYKPLAKNVMRYQDYNGYRYFWLTVKGLDNSTYYPYYYLVDGKYKVGDPYAHLVLDYNSEKWMGNNGFDPWPERPRYPYDIIDDAMMGVYKGDLDDYDWKVKDFPATNPVAYTNRDAMVVYEMLIRDFTGTSKKADGCYADAIEKIPYLYQLGVTAVELMPIMEFDGNESWGYNTNFYMAPDKSYGSPDQLKAFIDMCHQYGMAVILDIVFNHTPGLHPWYAMYDKGTSPFYNASCPHDYSVFEDIKQEYPLIEQHWVDVLTYWMTAYKVDGFRFDLVKGLGDSNSYGKGTEAYNQSRIDRMKRIHAAMKKVNPNVIHINEHLASAEEEGPMGSDGQLLWNNQSGNAANFVKGGNADLRYFNSAACGRPAGSTVDYAESHDEQRMGYHATSAGLSLGVRCKRLGNMAGELLTQPGPKMIWQFGELGFEETTKKSDGNNLTDAKEVHWEYVNNAERKVLLENYQKLNWLRRKNPEMFDRNVEMALTNFSPNDSKARAIRLKSGSKEIVACFNPGTGTAGVNVSTTVLNANNYVLITESRNARATLSGNGNNISVQLPAHCFAVFATPQVAGIEDIMADEISNDSRVYTTGHTIVIEGEYSNAAVYTVDGRTIAAGSQIGNIEVVPGIYIVNVDGVSTKVMVK